MTRQNKLNSLIPFILGFVDFLGVSIVIPLLAVNFKDKGYSPLLYGLAGTTYSTIQTLSGPLLGGYSDVHGRRKCVIYSFYLSGLVYAGFFFFDSILLFFLLRALLGFFKHSNTMCKAYLCDVTPKPDHASMIGRFNAISSSGFIIGPLIGGQIGKFEHGCLAAAILFVLSGVIAQLLLDECSPTNKGSESIAPPPSSVIEVYQSVEWPKYWDLFAVRLLGSIAVVLYRSNLSFLLMTTHSLSPQQIGYVMALTGLVAAASGFLAGPMLRLVRLDTVRLLLVTGVVMTASLLLLCMSSSLFAIMSFLTVFVAASSLARVYGLDALLKRGTGKDVGLLQGVSQSVTSVSRGSAPLISGILQQICQDLPAIAAALFAFSGTILNIYSVRKNHLKIE